MENQALTTKKISVVSYYLTPLAFIVLLQALLYTSEFVPLKIIGPLVGIAILNNLIFTYFVKKSPVLLIVRMFINVIVNIFLVYYLIETYTPIWFLLMLTPIATAVYSTRLKTFFCALGMSALLFIIKAMHGFEPPADWGSTFSRIIFIVLLSLFINAISQKSSPEKEFTGKKSPGKNKVTRGGLS